MLLAAYAAFNAGDVESVLATMTPRRDPAEWDGRRPRPRPRGVRDYWTRQWSVIDPRVEPLRFETDDAGRVVVEVHQVVRDRAGNVVADRVVQHLSELRDGQVRTMEIREPLSRS